MKDIDFDRIWGEIINKKCESLIASYGGLLIAENAKDEILTYYQEINQYVHAHYMKYPCGLLNRYKIGGILIIAILKAKPIKKVDEKFYKKSDAAWALNESVALYTALSVIRSFIEEDAEDNPNDQKNLLTKEVFEKIPLAEEERNNWEIELYHVRQEGCYNVLALAHELKDFVEKAVMKEVLNRLMSSKKTSS